MSERVRARRWLSRRLRDLAEVIDPTPAGWDLTGAPDFWADRVRAAGRRGAGARPVGLRSAVRPSPPAPGQQAAEPRTTRRPVRTTARRTATDASGRRRVETASPRRAEPRIDAPAPPGQQPVSRRGLASVRAVAGPGRLLTPPNEPARAAPRDDVEQGPPRPATTPGGKHPTGPPTERRRAPSAPSLPIPPPSPEHRTPARATTAPTQRVLLPVAAASPALLRGSTPAPVRVAVRTPGPAPAHRAARGDPLPPAAAVLAADQWPDLPTRPPFPPGEPPHLQTTLVQLARLVAEQEAT